MAGGGIPPGYREARYWRLTGNAWLFIALNGLAVVALVIFGAFFLWFAARFGGLQAAAIGNEHLVGLILGLFLTLALHELAHGVAMQTFGATPKYGILWRSLVAYTTAPGHAFTRGQYLVVSLAPLVVLSVFALALIALLAGSPVVWLLAMCASFNAAGAAGDLWMSAIVGRFPATTYVVDERDGMRIFVPA
jgi:hypothetical protein